MKSVLMILCTLVLFSCGKNGKNGANGKDAPVSVVTLQSLGVKTTGIDIQDVTPGLACANGGISVFTFNDINADGLFSEFETIIKTKVVCNGINGTNGTDGINGTNASITLEAVPVNSTCPTGGVKISSTTSSPVTVCNGKNGLNGEQGIQGVQGIPGMTGATGAPGADGTKVMPVKFCKTDNSTFPEYGLLIGDDLFAVYWGTTPASPTVPQAFLTKLIAGNYKSTGGNNCLFSIP